MLLACFLLFFLPLIASDDFDEITHRKFKAIKISKDRLKELVHLATKKDDLGTVMFVQCNRIYYQENLKSLLRRDDFSNARIPNAKLVNDIVHEKYGRLLHTTSLYTEFQGADFHFLFSFWQFEVDGPWELFRVQDLTCRRTMKISYIQEVIEMIQNLRNTEGKLAKNMLQKLFLQDSWFKFCDEAADQHFFHPMDSLSLNPVIIRDMVHFNRYTMRNIVDPHDLSVKGLFGANVSYIQVDVNVNRRRMLLEYDDDLKKFTKGREYSCERDNIHMIM